MPIVSMETVACRCGRPFDHVNPAQVPLDHCGPIIGGIGLPTPHGVPAWVHPENLDATTISLRNDFPWFVVRTLLFDWLHYKLVGNPLENIDGRQNF